MRGQAGGLVGRQDHTPQWAGAGPVAGVSLVPSCLKLPEASSPPAHPSQLKHHPTTASAAPSPTNPRPARRTQVCTGVMLHGYPMIKQLCGGLQEFMGKHGFTSVAEFTGGWPSTACTAGSAGSMSGRLAGSRRGSTVKG